MKDSKLKLTPSISISEKPFKEKFGPKKWWDFKVKLVHKHRFECQGCGEMFVNNDEWKKLSVHIISGDENEEDISKLNATVLCKACHFTQHFDTMASTGEFKFVNSFLSQGQLINECRKEYVYNERVMDILLENRTIIFLEKDPEEYVKEYLESTLNRNNKFKIVYTSKFKW